MSQSLRQSLRYSRSSAGDKTIPIFAKPSTKVETARPTRPPPVPHPAGHSSATTETDSSASQVQILSVQHADHVPLLLSGIRIHILPTKLDDSLADYRRKITTLGGELVPLPVSGHGSQVAKPDKPDLPLNYPHVVLTALKGRPRLSRLLNEYMVDFLDIVDIVWIDKIWQTAQDWAWGQNVPPVLAPKALSLDEQLHGIDEEPDDAIEDTSPSLLRAMGSSVPDLPDRNAYRIPKTSWMVLERIQNQSSLAVCEPAEVAVCLKVTMAQAAQLSHPPLGKRKRSGATSTDTGCDQPKRVKAGDPEGANDLLSLAKGFPLNSKGDLPEYLRNLFSNPCHLNESQPNITSEPDREVMVRSKHKNYGKLGKPGSVDIEHPEQDIQLLAMSSAEQEGAKPQVVEGVKTLRPLPYDIELADIPNLSIRRCSPLLCVNDDIVSCIHDQVMSRFNQMKTDISR
jgi:hypothetical protein